RSGNAGIEALGAVKFVIVDDHEFASPAELRTRTPTKPLAMNTRLLCDDDGRRRGDAALRRIRFLSPQRSDECPLILVGVPVPDCDPFLQAKVAWHPTAYVAAFDRILDRAVARIEGVAGPSGPAEADS